MDDSSNLDPLAERFRQPDLWRLLARLEARLRKGQDLSGRLRLANPTVAERRAINGLIGGTTLGSKSVSIDLDVLSLVAQRDGRFSSLRQLVETALGRPIEDDAAIRLAERQAWSAFWRAAFERCDSRPTLRPWLARLRDTGWLRRRSGGELSRSQTLLEQGFSVLERLPCHPPLSLAQLAAELLGDSHALDSDTDLGRLVARGAAALAERERPQSAADLRAAWTSVGVVPDELSATVLVLNLPACSGTTLGDLLGLLSRSGEPGRVTFRQLRGGNCRFDASLGDQVFVCENPAVVSAAADRLGSASAPLVCVEGQPNLAAERLLAMLKEQGFTLRYHGDFDWGGFRIAGRLWRQFHFLPWRYETANYLAAAPGRLLRGVPVETPWDPALRLALEALGVAVHEEAVLEALLQDLRLP